MTRAQRSIGAARGWIGLALLLCVAPVPAGVELAPSRAQPGDVVLLSGEIAVHGWTEGSGLRLDHAYPLFPTAEVFVITDIGRDGMLSGPNVAATAALAHEIAIPVIASGGITNIEDVRALWKHAVDTFGSVDIWINNAGIGHQLAPMWELPPERVQAIVDTNILGLMHGSRVAIWGMLAQGHGQLYNMEGAGSRGHARHGMSVYATSKAAVMRLTEDVEIPTLQELGLNEDEIPDLAKIAYEDPQTIGNPRDLSVKSYEQIYKHAFELGK